MAEINQSLGPDNTGTDKAITAKIVTIVAVFALISVLFAAQIYVYGIVHEGIRAFVRGEGLWSKAQKEAAHHIVRYTQTNDPADYQAFLENIRIPLGDKKARLALSQTPPDYEAAREGLLAGGNHPDDLANMVAVFIHFSGFEHMRDAIRIWTEGDSLIDLLVALAQSVDRELKKPAPNQEIIATLRKDILALDARLQPLEEQFSNVLSEGARWVRTLSLKISLVLLAVLVGAGILASHRIVRGISRQLAWQQKLQQQVYREAREDPLTGLYNRKFFNEQFDRYMKLAQREKRHCALLYLDLDRFKPVNDVYGHTVGDKVLKEAAKILTAQLRSTDLIARIGGDEFVILLVHPCDRDGVAISGERIIQALAQPIRIDGVEIKVGASIGAALFPEDGDTVDALLKKADNALYAAKQSGRGKLIFHSGLDETAHAADNVVELG